MNKESYFAEAMPANNMSFTDMGCCNRPMEMMGETMPGVVCPPIYECPRETVCHRYICHEVPHIMPCNTRIINHHVYAFYSRLCRGMPSAAKKQKVLLQDKSFRVGFLNGVPNEKERRGTCLNMYFINKGSGNAFLNDMPLCGGG